MASDPTYSAKIRRTDGGDTIDVAPGGKITANGTQAAHIADVTGGTTTDAEARAAIASILNALEGVGILAAS